MDIKQRHTPQGVVFVIPNGKIVQIQGVPEMKRTISDLIKNGSRKIVMDLEYCTGMDAVGIRHVVECQTAVVAKGGALKLVHVPRQVWDLLVSQNLSKQFRIHPTHNDAIASFNAEPKK